MRTIRLLCSVAILALVLASTACSQTSDPTHAFALVGDNPYAPADIPVFEALIRDVNGRDEVRWVVHLGDIRGADTTCSDETITARFDIYQQFDLPFVYTPGDNDWFDCGGEAQGGYDDYERLHYLRSLFYPDPASTTGRRTMPVRSQSEEAGYEEYVENVMWTYGDIVYATVHLVALTRPPTSADVASRRMDAAIAWIGRAFELARDSGSVGVFIATQADPWIVSGLPPLVRQMCPTCAEGRAGLERLHPVLVQNADAFSGQVVLAVGDTHVFRIDKPLYRADGTLVENFTRVETFGYPYVHWVRVTVDPRDRQVFTFHQELVPENAAR